jgi:hypothetical protein
MAETSLRQLLRLLAYIPVAYEADDIYGPAVVRKGTKWLGNHIARRKTRRELQMCSRAGGGSLNGPDINMDRQATDGIKNDSANRW